VEAAGGGNSKTTPDAAAATTALVLPKVGDTVHLKASKEAFLAAFEGSSNFVWDDGMEAILGTDQPVVELKGPGAFGLKEARAERGQPVWWYPFSVIEKIVTKEVDSPDFTERSP